MDFEDKGQAIEGLVEFYEHWHTLRTQAVALSKSTALTEEQAIMIEWMIRVIDRVGPADLLENGDS